jgi:hypothetical protein
MGRNQRQRYQYVVAKYRNCLFLRKMISLWPTITKYGYLFGKYKLYVMDDMEALSVFQFRGDYVD